jgi:hypothetical protein
MNKRPLRPPLPESLTHDGIEFIFDRSSLTGNGGELDQDILALIAAGLQAILPEGDLIIDQGGQIARITNPDQPIQTASLWYQIGLIEGIDRSFK